MPDATPLPLFSPHNTAWRDALRERLETALDWRRGPIHYARITVARDPVGTWCGAWHWHIAADSGVSGAIGGGGPPHMLSAATRAAAIAAAAQCLLAHLPTHYRGTAAREVAAIRRAVQPLAA